LWRAATDLARIDGLNPTVVALQLEYYDLQRRLQAVGNPDVLVGGALAAPRF